MTDIPVNRDFGAKKSGHHSPIFVFNLQNFAHEVNICFLHLKMLYSPMAQVNIKHKGALMETITLSKLPNKEERAKIGKAARTIYERLHETLEKKHWGEYVAINVENGDYIVSAEQEDATEQMRAKYPGLLPFIIRIGYRAVYHFSGTGVNDGRRV